MKKKSSADPNTELHLAILDADPRRIRLHLLAGADPNATGRSDMAVIAHHTPLWSAANLAGMILSGAWEALSQTVGNPRSSSVPPDNATIHANLVEAARLLIEAGADPEKPSFGTTPLAQAVHAGDSEMTRLLLAHGASAQAESFSPLSKLARQQRVKGPCGPMGYLNTVLHTATRKGSMEILQALLAAGADPNRPDHEGKLPLDIAEESGSSEAVDILRARTSRQPADRPADIWLAAGNGDLEGLQRCLASGSHVDAADEGKVTPLHKAAFAGHTPLVAWLLSNGAKVNPRTGRMAPEGSGVTPLHEAILGGRTETARLLITQGANVNAKMSDGSTPLHLAAGEGNEHLVELLVEHGAKPEAQARGGCTPFVLAMMAGHLQVAGFLLRHGADPNRRMEPFDCTALMLVSGQKLRAAVDFLLESGADAALRDARGQNALHHAVSGAAADQVVEIGPGVDVPEGSAEDAVAVVERLLDAGADPAARDDEGKTPLTCARALRLAQIVSVLERAGRKRLK